MAMCTHLVTSLCTVASNHAVPNRFVGTMNLIGKDLGWRLVVYCGNDFVREYSPCVGIICFEAFVRLYRTVHS